MNPRQRKFALISVRLACERSARTTIQKLGRGKSSLNAIAITASTLGSLALFDGTRFGLILAAQDSQKYGDIAFGWSEQFVPLALSLAVATFALTTHRFLSASLTNLSVEINAAILQLHNDLVRAHPAA